MQSAKKTIWGYRHKILFVIWLLYVINYLDRISVLTLLPYIGDDLQRDTAQIGLLGSIFFFGYALAQFSAGILSDRIGAKKTMSIAIVIFTVVTFLTAWVFVGTVETAVKIGLLDTCVKIAAFYFHERVWNRLSFGQMKPPEYQI